MSKGNFTLHERRDAVRSCNYFYNICLLCTVYRTYELGSTPKLRRLAPNPSAYIRDYSDNICIRSIAVVHHSIAG